MPERIWYSQYARAYALVRSGHQLEAEELTTFTHGTGASEEWIAAALGVIDARIEAAPRPMSDVAADVRRLVPAPKPG